MDRTIRGLYGIADLAFRPEVTLAEKLDAFLDGGATVLQLRAKLLPAAETLELALQALRHVAGRVPLIVNDRPDVALAAGADGVHVGEDDLPVAAVRKLMGRRIVGATVRSLEEACQAARDGADYVGFGPVFPTSTKSLAVETRGLTMLAEVVAGCPIPVVAIGGMTLERAGEVARTGAAALAVVSDVLGASDAPARARAIAQAFGDAFPRGAR